MNFKTNISIAVRAGESHDPADINFLQELKINLYTHENLHAKYYLNHKAAIITSMNLYEYSQLNNTELGMIVTKDGDPKLYEQINETVKKIIRNSKEFEFEIKKVDKTKASSQASEKKLKIFHLEKSQLPKNSVIVSGALKKLHLIPRDRYAINVTRFGRKFPILHILRNSVMFVEKPQNSRMKNRCAIVVIKNYTNNSPF